jgi:hypothetical protein
MVAMNEPLHFTDNGRDSAIITEEANLAHPEGVAIALYDRTSPKFTQIGATMFLRPEESKEKALVSLKTLASSTARS